MSVSHEIFRILFWHVFVQYLKTIRGSCMEIDTVAIVVFPSQNNNNVRRVVGVLQSCENVGIFSSALSRPDDP